MKIHVLANVKKLVEISRNITLYLFLYWLLSGDDVNSSKNDVV